MVRGGNTHRLKLIASLLKHLTKIFEAFSSRVHIHYLLGLLITHIHITECHNFYHAGLGKLIDVLLTTVTYTYISNLYFVEFRLLNTLVLCQNIYAIESQPCRKQGCSFKEITS